LTILKDKAIGNRAVVFAYHNVGVRCLSVLLAQGIEVALVVTHQDSPTETIWFESVAKLAALHGIPTITPDDVNAPEVIAHIASLQPDFLFSFYFRQMLKPALLAIAKRGAYNMHGSLLPHYRGRVPVNWAVIRGEAETGASLHEMVEKPDAGRLVGQQVVPILPNDTAFDVFNKVTVAAEITLAKAVPLLIAGSASPLAQNLAQGSYFGGRRPEDGRIHWDSSASSIHDLVRGVAPPYPGAFCEIDGKSVRILKTLLEQNKTGPHAAPTLFIEANQCYAQCGDGGVLRIVDIEIDGKLATPTEIERQFGSSHLLPVFLPPTA